MSTTVPNLDIYDFEGALEQAMNAALVAGDFIANTAVQRQADDLSTSRVECKYVSGGCDVNHHVTRGGNKYAIVWAGTLFVKIVTERTKAAGTDTHRNIVAGVRWTGQNAKELIQPNMPIMPTPIGDPPIMMHTITRFIETSASPAFNNEKNIDVTGLAFAVVLAINPNALPQS